MMKIDNIWRKLEADESIQKGLLLRRYSGTISPDVFVALRFPERSRCIAISLSREFNFNIKDYDKLKDIKVEIVPNETDSSSAFLVFNLLNNQFVNIFSVLCEDLFNRIASIDNQIQLIKAILNRFEQWKTLFNKLSSNPLTSEEQRGLYGELYFLRKMFNKFEKYNFILKTWTGPEGQDRDFQYSNWSIEVKTSIASNHQKIKISNERQLDTKNIDSLLLFHLSLDTRRNDGETLNDIIEEIFKLLGDDTLSTTSFIVKLLEVGYLREHKEFYEDIGYLVRDENFYEIKNEFPRIEEKDLRSGVGDVSYSISASKCADFKVNEINTFDKLSKWL